MKTTTLFSALSNRELIAETKRLALNESRATAALIRSLIELDARRLYLAEGCGSLFKYCTEVLHLSEDAAYNRLEVAAAARRLPEVLDALEEGALTLTAARRLAPHLTEENCADVLAAAKFKSKSVIEALIAALSPQPDVTATVRKLPQPANHTPVPQMAPVGEVLPEEPKLAPTATAVALPESAPPKPDATRTTMTSISTRALVQPLAPERFKVQFTIGSETRDKLKEVQDLLRHSIRNGDLEQIFDRAITLLLKDARRQRFADTARPREGRELLPGSRHVPAAVQRFVWQRDEGRCAFVGPNGRCNETSLLQFHHADPFAMGGPPTAENTLFVVPHTTVMRPNSSSPSTTRASSARSAPTGPKRRVRPGTKLGPVAAAFTSLTRATVAVDAAVAVAAQTTPTATWKGTVSLQRPRPHQDFLN